MKQMKQLTKVNVQADTLNWIIRVNQVSNPELTLSQQVAMATNAFAAILKISQMNENNLYCFKHGIVNNFRGVCYDCHYSHTVQIKERCSKIAPIVNKFE